MSGTPDVEARPAAHSCVDDAERQRDALAGQQDVGNEAVPRVPVLFAIALVHAKQPSTFLCSAQARFHGSALLQMTAR